MILSFSTACSPFMLYSPLRRSKCTSFFGPFLSPSYHTVPSAFRIWIMCLDKLFKSTNTSHDFVFGYIYSMQSPFERVNVRHALVPQSDKVSARRQLDAGDKQMTLVMRPTTERNPAKSREISLLARSRSSSFLGA